MSRFKVGLTLLLGALLGAALVLGTAEGAGASVVARVLAFTNASYPLGAAPTGSQVLGLSSGTVRGVDAATLSGGLVPTSQLGSGSATSSTYLRGDGTWATVAAGISGSTGSTDNRLIRSDGTGGATIQSSAATLDDSGNLSGLAATSTTTIELGHSSDTTLARASAGDLTVEGNALYRAGGTDVALVDGGTGASDRRTAVGNLWARHRLRVVYSAQGDGFQSERGAPAGLMSSAIGTSGDRLYWSNFTSASASTPGFTTLAARYMYSTGGPYMAGVGRFSSFTSTRTYFGAQSGSSIYSGGRTAFGSVKYIGFALDTATDTTLYVVTSDGSTVAATNTTLTPTAGGWLFLEWYLQGSTMSWAVANCTDITCTSYSSSATGTHTGSLPSAQTLGWQASLTPAAGTPSLSVDLAWVEVGQY